MFSFVSSISTTEPGPTIVNIKRIEPEATSMQACNGPPRSYILHLATGAVRQWLCASNLYIFSTKINSAWTTSIAS